MTSKAGKILHCAALISGVAVSLLLSLAIPAGAQYDIYDLGYTVNAQDIRADNTNTVHIIWVDWDTLYYGKIANNAISGKMQVASGIDISMWRPYLSVRPDGYSVHVAWTTRGFGNTLMHSWKTTGGWATESLLTVPGTQKLSQATCAVDSSGIVHMMFVIWNNVPADDWATIFYMRKLANGQWEPMEKFIPYNVQYEHPLLINDVHGRVHATWTLQGRYGSDLFDCYYCMAPSGGKLSYTDMMKIPKAAGCDANGYGELYVDYNGVVHRTIGGWSSARGKMCLDHARKPVGAGFETPTRASIGFLSTADPMPVVIANEDGKAIVAWGEIGNDGSNTVKASFYDPGKDAWSLHTIDPAAGIPTGQYVYRVAITRTDSQLFLAWRGSNGNLKLLVMPLEGTLPDEPPPPPPSQEDPVAVLTATPTSGGAPLAVSLDGSASYDPDGSIVSYLWSFGDGGTGTGAIVNHTYTASGTFTARLTVTDNDGNTDGASKVIKVQKPNQPPVADFTLTPSTGIYPCAITFDAGGSRDPDGKIVQFSWSFGDGSRGSGRVVRYTYTTWGTFSVGLTVRDDAGATANKIRSIEIRRLYQPLNIRWETHKDESLFQTRYVNYVSWERNPANDPLGVQILLHRIWRKGAGESDLVYRPIGEVTADVFSYTDKDTDVDNTYVYTVTVRDSQGHESPIVGAGGNSSLSQSNKDSHFLFKNSKLGKKKP